MPELPEVEALVGFLGEQARGQVFEKVAVGALSALKTYEPPVDALVGRTVVDTERRGKFLLIDTDGLWLVLHLARAGWVRWKDLQPTAPVKPGGKSPLALRVRFESGAGFDVTEAGTEKRLAAYVVRSPEDIDWISSLGPDPLDPAFDLAALATLLASTKAQVKGVLTDQALIAGVGNAYSDEALHVARLSPFRPANKLTAEEVERLFLALRTVLSDAVERSRGLPASGLKSEKRSGMRVHGRAGQA